MLYNLLFSPSFNKDFSHLLGPPVDAKWDKFKKSVYGYIIQGHATGSGGKTFYFISNTQDYLAFGLYASIHDFARVDRVDERYAMRRRGGDHSVKENKLEGDYPTEATIGYYWDKNQGSLLSSDDIYLDITTNHFLHVFETEIEQYWDRPRKAVSAREHAIKQTTLKSSRIPHINVSGCKKALKLISSTDKAIFKVNVNDEERLFYTLVHQILHGNIVNDFSFCTDFSKSFFKGQNHIDFGTIRTRKSGVLKGPKKCHTDPDYYVESDDYDDYMVEVDSSDVELENEQNLDYQV